MVSTMRSIFEFFNRSIAGPDSTPCVAIAHTSLAPCSMRHSAAATMVDGKVVGRLDARRFDAVLAKVQS